MAPSKFNVKMALRDAMFTELVEINEKLKKGGLSKAELKVNTEQAGASWRSFQKIHQDAMDLCSNQSDIDELLEGNKSAVAIYTELLREIEKSCQEAKDMPIPAFSEVKLAKFSGDWTEWAGWSAIYITRVMDTGLSVSQKIDLLLEALTGDARDVAGKSEKRDQNELTRIWGKLVETYDDPYQQAFAHIVQILTLPIVLSPSPAAYRALVNKTQESLRLLERYNVFINWNAILCVLLLQKLDPEARYLYNTSCDKSGMPNVDTLFKFLVSRSRALEENDRTLIMYPHKDHVNTVDKAANQARLNAGWNPTNSFVKRHSFKDSTFKRFGDARPDSKPYPQPTPRVCPICDNPNHPIYHCPAFLEMSVSHRISATQQKNLCVRCLRVGHHVNSCLTARSCEICGGAHNKLICGTSRRNIN